MAFSVNFPKETKYFPSGDQKPHPPLEDLVQNQCAIVGEPIPPDGEGKPGRTAIYRNGIYSEGVLDDLWILGEKIAANTLHDMFERCVKLYSDKPFLGHRPKIEEERWGPYVWKTYAETKELVVAFHSALVEVGIEAKTSIGIYAINRPEWIITEQACYRGNMIPVALYDTLGPNAVEFIIGHSELELVVTSPDHLVPLLKKLKISSDEGKKSLLRHLVVLDTYDKNNFEITDLAKELEIELITWDRFLENGRQAPKDANPPIKSDLCTIMYTSGTSGNPKGVLLTHGNAVAMMSSVARHREIGHVFCNGYTHISFLPLAHSYERMVCQTALLGPGKIGFFCGSLPHLLNDIAELKPTHICGAPRVWQRIHDKMMANINGGSAIKRGMFNFMYWWKDGALKSGGMRSYESAHWLTDAIVFKKTKALLGGNVKFLVSGSAPLDPKLADFLRVVFAAPMIQGYGLTESYAASTVQMGMDTSSGHVGPPSACNEIVLEDVPELDYYSTDKPYPRGEVLIRGPNVFAGYHKNEELTKEVMTEDGFFRTGDIGMFGEHGQLYIIDRRKNIFKLQQGEYLAPENLETVFVRAEIVQQCFVYGNSFSSYALAVVVPNPDLALKFARDEGIIPANSEDTEKAYSDPKVKELIMKAMKEVGVQANLKGYEYPKDILLEPELFSVENGLLTPSFKQKRSPLTAKYKTRLEEMRVAIDSNA